MKIIRKRTAKAFIFIVLIVSVLSLGGCVKKYTRNDIKSYAKKITGRTNLTVSENYQEIQEDEEGYLDHLWTVVDEDSKVTFHVLDDFYWALEEVENSLLNDYNSSVFLSLLESGQIPQENSLSLKKTEKSGLLNVELSGIFTDMDGLKRCYVDLKSVKEAVAEAGYPDVSISYTIKYMNPIRGVIDYEVDEGDTSGELGSLDETSFSAMRMNYLRCALDYRFEDALREFSEKEIHALVHDRYSVRIYRTSREAALEGGGQKQAPPPSQEDYIEGVIGSPRFAGISFGTLYELLKIEGFNPKGNAWHYAVRATDGSLLEFSYDFNDLSGFNDNKGKLQKGYYYISDGKKIRMSTYYDNHFEASEIGKLTGLYVAEDRPHLSGMSE